MSSTTEARRRERGQILILFAGGLVLILLIAALVFDVGQNLLDRRTEQNAADAAALAGAMHIVGAAPYHGGCAAAPATRAVQVACSVAAENGFVDGVGAKTVRVDIPPVAPSTKANFPLHIQVSIGSTRPSFFQGIIGVTKQRTGAMGVATNGSDIALPVSLLALDPTGCGTNKITGAPGTAVTTNGTVQIDSSCPTSALLLSGNGVLTAPECDVVGGIQTSGGAVNSCAAAPDDILAMGDPLRNLASPAKPGAPLAVQALDVMAGPIPDSCPGGSAPATDAAPASCSFSKPTMNGKTYRIHPGYYPGGIEVTRATVYMSPGIYWIGGGGIEIRSTGGNYGRLISKALGDDAGLAPSGGVLIYNSVASACGTGGGGCYGTIHLNGGDGSTLALRPIQSGFYKNMVIFVDRDAATGTGDIDLNGEGSTLDITGTIYAPTSEVKFNGSDTTVASAQVICFNFVVNGSGSSFTIDYDSDNLFHLRGTGLVE